jgi:Ca2+-transporting ATPase
MQSLLGKHWHHLPTEEVIDLLDTNGEKGLDRFEVKHRQERFGPNRISVRKGKSPLRRFLHQFHNPLIYILLASSVITAVVKAELVDALIIFGVVLVNAVIGFIQEAQAERAIQALASAMVTEANVIRAGSTLRIPAPELVPGDLVILKSGDKIPADIRLVKTRDLQVMEASLTGESVPAEKAANGPLPHDAVLAERNNMAYTSTLVTYGQGNGIVVATGDNTEIGKISKLISSSTDLATPLTRKIAHVSHILLVVILALAGITFLAGVLRGQSAVDTFTAAVALAVAAIPEGLPAALTVTLAIGVSRMARRKAIIRKLPAVETLGSVTVICSDKTGTLTQNQMTVQEIIVSGATYTLTGSGYAPWGEIHFEGEKVGIQPNTALEQTLVAGLLCNDSSLVENNSMWEASGDPTEVALIVAAKKTGLQTESLITDMPRLDEIPFDSRHQFMATLHDQGVDKPRIVFLKGASEAIMERCISALDRFGQKVPLDRNQVHEQVEALARKGIRVLAFASLELPEETQLLSNENILSGFTFLGLQGMIDPPRPEAIEAVRACQSAGIRVKMITGDHASTAAAIAAQIGISNPSANLTNDETPQVLTGKSLAQLTDTELVEQVRKVDVFARVSPEQKLRLVEALQASGEVVAMTGDGVNDGPALKQANIGVAMGITGTEVAKEAADMVLTNDNFYTIQAAVEEGRGIFDNLTKIIAWTLPTNIGEGLVILLAVLLGITLPILPVQILWINMVTVSVLGLVLALEKNEPDLMLRQPRNPEAPILTRNLLWRILIVGIIILISAFGIFEWELSQNAGISAARTAAVNAVVLISIFYLFNARSLTQSIFTVGLFSNPWALGGVAIMMILQALFTYVPWMNSIFDSAPINAEAWARIILIGFASFCIIELEKWIGRYLQARTSKLKSAPTFSATTS